MTTSKIKFLALEKMSLISSSIFPKCYQLKVIRAMCGFSACSGLNVAQTFPERKLTTTMK